MDLDLSNMFERRLAAAGADSLVDLNRDLANKPVGVRRLALVALGQQPLAWLK